MGYLIGWACIGLAGALGACIWPFRRGALGVVLNVTSGVLGAVAGPSLGVVLGMSPESSAGLPLAGIGALALLTVVHLSWSRPRTPPRRHVHRRHLAPRV